MTIGICSLWHNTPELLPEFELLLRAGGWDEAILVDNASDPDACAAYARTAERTGCKVVGMAENNVLRGWNAGMSLLNTTIKICMASDVFALRRNWPVYASAGAMPGAIAGPFARRFIDGTLYLDGSLIAFHADDWERLGGLDEGYLHPGYVSDVDICWRAQEMGILIKRVNAGSVLHLGNYTTGLRKGQIHPTWYANRDRFLAKKDLVAKKATAQ